MKQTTTYQYLTFFIEKKKEDHEDNLSKGSVQPPRTPNTTRSDKLPKITAIKGHPPYSFVSY